MPGAPVLEPKKLTDADLVDVNRSRLYRLLALGFGFPRRELQEAQGELWQLADTLYPELKLSREERNLLTSEIESLYINVLDGHAPGKECRPYETAWRDDDRSMAQWEVKKFYGTFGLALNEKTREMPDHIVNELEFMHVLAHLAVAAGRGKFGDNVGRGRYVHAQKDFLERHLCRWIPEFCQALQEKTDEPFYNQLAVLTAQFVEDDLAWIRDQFEAGEGVATG